MEPFSIFDPQNRIFAHFLTFRPWGGRLRKTVKNLVEFEDFWEPQSPKTRFGAHFSKFSLFLRFGAPKRKNHTFEPKMRKIAKFPFFAFWRSERTDRQRTGSSVAPPFSRLWNEARGRGSAPPHSNEPIFPRANKICQGAGMKNGFPLCGNPFCFPRSGRPEPGQAMAARRHPFFFARRGLVQGCP